MYDYTYNSNLLAMLGGFVLILGLFFLVCLIIIVVSKYCIFEKAGKPGWAAFIPYYNTYVSYEMLNMQDLFVVFIIASLAGFFLSGILATLAGIVVFGLNIYENINLAKAFGKSTGFMVGLVLVPIVFYPILAFGGAEYQPENL